MSALIYRITNQINGKSYIGQTTQSLNKRWTAHCSEVQRGSLFWLHAAIRKYGKSSFTIELLETTTIEQLNDRERYWIATLSPHYNMTSGGDGVANLCESSRSKKSLALKGRTFSESTRDKLRRAALGRSPTAETRAKLSAAMKGRTFSNETRAKLREAARRPRRPLSDEHRKKIAAANCKRKHSIQTRAKISASNRGRKRSSLKPEHKAAIAASNKRRANLRHSIPLPECLT
jgi:group I intron endonuclease